ncbi:uncharacterized protein [Anabrus simplex]|uniref:uncharacterized protein n=1 Tax=Anabrus simplex TaxID=316456 RepID=UPI0034DD6FDF
MAAHFSLVPSCCGITLKNGTLWLAEICTMVGVVLVIFSSFAIDEVLYHWHWYNNYGIVSASLHGVGLVLGIFQTMTSALLGYAAYKEIPKLMLPWVIFYSVQTVALFVLMILFSIWCIIYFEPIPLGIILFLVTTAYCHAFRYFILVVYSYYRQLLVCATDSSNHVMQLA